MTANVRLGGPFPNLPCTCTAMQEELAAELCLLAPARLEHLIPPMPRMMHAVLRALRGSDQSVAVALKVCASSGDAAVA